MGTAQVTFTAEELLASHDYAEPLFANGIACHGGFDEDGTYVSPRTRFRGPAIEAWEAKRVEDFGTERVRSLSRDEVEARLEDFRELTRFE